MAHNGFTSERFGDFFHVVLPKGETPLLPHPEGKRWGLVRQGGDTMLYAGRYHAIFTSPRRLRELEASRMAKQSVAA